jgi:Ca2+-binding EF-hand superfamily protein
MNEKLLIELFDNIDTNKDGQISEKELKLALHNAGRYAITKINIYI